ncbi:MAG: FHA domain-containing protein [Planctomycetota bacterium]|nr:FHA domain-containing protein [Planctomycetota bacterium]
MKVSEGFMLRVLNGEFRGRVFPLQDSLDIGSGGDCGLRLRDAAVSSSHARLQREGDEVVIEDLGSSIGTYLNDKSVERAHLKKGDLLRIGRTHLSVISRGRGGQGDGASGNSSEEGLPTDTRLLQRARSAEARKVQLEKARARLTRENEELQEKLAFEEARRRELERRLGDPDGLSESIGEELLERERMKEELKSALEIRTRLAILLKAARKKIAHLEAVQDKADQGRILSLQEELDSARREQEEEARRHQQESAGARVSTEELEQARIELCSLGESCRESEAAREDLDRTLAVKEAELAEFAEGRKELLLKLEAAEEEKGLLESSRGRLEEQNEEADSLRAEVSELRKELALRAEGVEEEKGLLASSQAQVEKQREESTALRAEVRDLQRQLESLAAERAREAEGYRGELENMEADNRRRLEDKSAEFQEPLAKRIDELEDLNARLAAELETSQSEFQERAVELEQGVASRAELEERYGEAERDRELLDGELVRQRETVVSQAESLGELESRFQEVSNELSRLGLEREERAERLERELDVLGRRLASAENKRQAQEGRFDGLEDERLRLSGELLLLKRYADDVRRRLLEKEALVDDLESRLRISAAPGTQT